MSLIEFLLPISHLQVDLSDGNRNDGQEVVIDRWWIFQMVLLIFYSITEKLGIISLFLDGVLEIFCGESKLSFVVVQDQ